MQEIQFLEFMGASNLPQAFPNYLINSLGPKFFSQGQFHSLQLLNLSQFLFSRVVRLKTAPRGNFIHA